jgi:hypothetical protein
MLDASTRVAAAARSGLIDHQVAFVVDHAQMGHLDKLMLSLAWKLTLQASGGSDTRRAAIHRRAACMLDASTRVGAAARSGLIDHHVAFVVDHADGTPRRPCRWDTSGGSDTPSSYTQTRSVHARRIYACRSGRKKRPHRSSRCIRRRPCRWDTSTSSC